MPAVGEFRKERSKENYQEYHLVQLTFNEENTTNIHVTPTEGLDVFFCLKQLQVKKMLFSSGKIRHVLKDYKTYPYTNRTGHGKMVILYCYAQAAWN